MKKQGVDRVCKFRGICGEVQNGAPVRGFGPPPAAVGRSAEASAGAGISGIGIPDIRDELHRRPSHKGDDSTDGVM